MFKKRVFIPIFIIVVLVGLAWGFVEFSKNSLEKDIRKHLYNEGYSQEDIKQIKAKLGSVPLFSATVIFSDEPNVLYFYLKNSRGVIQYANPVDIKSRDNSNFKHSEINN